jgi:hypothetical protein
VDASTTVETNHQPIATDEIDQEGQQEDDQGGETYQWSELSRAFFIHSEGKSKGQAFHRLTRDGQPDTNVISNDTLHMVRKILNGLKKVALNAADFKTAEADWKTMISPQTHPFVYTDEDQNCAVDLVLFTFIGGPKHESLQLQKAVIALLKDKIHHSRSYDGKHVCHGTSGNADLRLLKENGDPESEETQKLATALLSTAYLKTVPRKTRDVELECTHDACKGTVTTELSKTGGKFFVGSAPKAQLMIDADLLTKIDDLGQAQAAEPDNLTEKPPTTLKKAANPGSPAKSLTSFAVRV